MISPTGQSEFEPTIDVCPKIPRFTFEKFPSAEAQLSTSMKSVGETMAVGRSFKESLQKALRSLETGLTGLNSVPLLMTEMKRDCRMAGRAGSRPHPADRGGAASWLQRRKDRCLHIMDPWFLEQIAEITEIEDILSHRGTRKPWADAAEIPGFSDAAVGTERHSQAGLPAATMLLVSAPSSSGLIPAGCFRNSLYVFDLRSDIRSRMRKPAFGS